MSRRLTPYERERQRECDLNDAYYNGPPIEEVTVQSGLEGHATEAPAMCQCWFNKDGEMIQVVAGCPEHPIPSKAS